VAVSVAEPASAGIAKKKDLQLKKPGAATKRGLPAFLLLDDHQPILMPNSMLRGGRLSADLAKRRRAQKKREAGLKRPASRFLFSSD
jgi:hypothetical protein